ncbi:unnamed protein product [Mytilus coruscus]|uniref:Reverse transcriptase domain-containing protein n=1 Tax=Mytilus coruscus TaxID=42192 RepID=A0A6J8AX17_MYTCO|nr:unnamed protein product [Mytilus coruscus]
MEDVLRGLQWEECLLYMDDIIVPGETFEEELLRLEHVFQRMREANLKLKPSKCILFQKSVKFLGHVVSEHGVQTDPEKIEAEHDGREHVVAYTSKALNKHGNFILYTRKELLAVIIALKNFDPYVYGRPVLLRTDNAAVSWLQSLKDPTGQVARWLQTLGTYNFKVTHRAGSKHTNADAMSRNQYKSCKRQEDLKQAENFDDREVSDHPVECAVQIWKNKKKQLKPCYTPH